MPQLFDLGQVVITANLQRTLDNGDPNTNSMEELQGFLHRHVSGDWGDLGEEDKRENQLLLERGFRIFSAYNTSSGIRVWIITEADRTVTTALLPQDY